MKKLLMLILLSFIWLNTSECVPKKKMLNTWSIGNIYLVLYQCSFTMPEKNQKVTNKLYKAYKNGRESRFQTTASKAINQIMNN